MVKHRYIAYNLCYKTRILLFLKLNTMKRLKFIKQVSSIMLIGLPLLAITSSCDSNADDPAPAPFNPDKDCLANGTNTSIGTNHGHSLTVSKTDVSNGVDKTYAIGGSAGHDHNVIISAANFTTLKNNNSIQLSSTSGDGHTHNISVSCA